MLCAASRHWPARAAGSSFSRGSASLWSTPSSRSLAMSLVLPRPPTALSPHARHKAATRLFNTSRMHLSTPAKQQDASRAVQDAATATSASTAAKKATNWKDTKRLFRLAKPEAKSITAAIGLLLISSGITMSVPFSMGRIIDIVTNPESAKDKAFGLSLPEFFGVLGIVFTVGATANMGRVMLFRLSGERIIQRLRNDLYKNILRQEMAFFDRNRTGELISRLSTDAAIVGKSVTNNVSDGLRALATATVGSGMMLYVSPHLTGIMMLVVPPVAMFAIVYGRYVKKLSRRTQTAVAEITKVSEEKISAIRTVQAFAKEDLESKHYASKVMDLYQLAKKEALASGAFFGGAGLSGNLAILSVLWYGGDMVLNNVITIGELASFMLYTAYVGTSLGGLTSFYSEIAKAIGASDRLFELLERKSHIPVDSGKVLDNLKGKIRFQNVFFSYPTRDQNTIFKNLSLTVNPGTVVAVVGPSGSGKSTIGALLLRYYDADAGNVFVDDVNIKDVNLHWWRDQVGVVSQEPTLFHGTIAENIAYGRPDATMDDIKRAATLANCASFIESFHNKYDTMVGERSTALSGGQKQRIAIARALLKNPSILVLDEATSALDSESELLVQEALNRLMHGRTVFTIAHRLSTIRSADVVACIDNGRIAELGTYNELLNIENGTFRRLVELQSLTQVDHHH
ncbi:ATP-binding cassette sub-family B member 10, mitochondrial [Gongronella butleri]|nr:ATP-binding cassette sub-family B member 10, mitochondrial [Gongronella butleri]